MAFWAGRYSVNIASIDYHLNEKKAREVVDPSEKPILLMQNTSGPPSFSVKTDLSKKFINFHCFFYI